MRFMMIVKADRDYEAGAPPKPELMAAIGKLSEEMIKAGVLLDMGGLLPSSKGARIDVKQGRLTVIDGPFAEAKELIGGYAILQVKSREEAIERAGASCSCTQMCSGPHTRATRDSPDAGCPATVRVTRAAPRT